MDPASPPDRPEFDQLVAALRAAGDRRMAERAERRALFAEVTAKAEALRAPQAPQHDAGAHQEERRRQLREQHQKIMQKALDACRAGHLTVMQVAELQALRLRIDEELEG